MSSCTSSLSEGFLTPGLRGSYRWFSAVIDHAPRPRVPYQGGRAASGLGRPSNGRRGPLPLPTPRAHSQLRGADQAAARLLGHAVCQEVATLKVNPDAPQRPLRLGALQQGITLYMPTPRLWEGFYRIDFTGIPAARLKEAASLSRSARWAEAVPLEALGTTIDLVVTGSVAVTPSGKRCGKGHGYGDLEYAILRELGHPAVPVATTVHPLQVVTDFPTDALDLTVSFLATPYEIMEVSDPPPAPAGIDWDALPEGALKAMPVLKELKAR